MQEHKLKLTYDARKLHNKLEQTGRLIQEEWFKEEVY